MHGRVKGEDELVDTTITPLALAETYEGGRHRFDGHIELTRAGAFGYTVRILPKNPDLASPRSSGWSRWRRGSPVSGSSSETAPGAASFTHSASFGHAAGGLRYAEAHPGRRTWPAS